MFSAYGGVCDNLTANMYNEKTLSIIIKAQDQASRVLADIGDTVAKVSKIAATAVAAGAVAFATFGVKSAAAFEQTRIGLENMLGSADKAKAVLKEVNDFAAKTPFEFPELAGAVKQLIAFGFTGDDAIKTMKQLGDVSAAVGAPIGDLSYLMGTLKTQGRAFTVDIRQFASRGIPIYEYLAKVMGTSEQAISKMVEEGKIGFPQVQKAFEAMTAQGGKFHGAMAAQSKTLGGLFSTLKDSIGATARELVGLTAEGDVKAGSLFDKLRISAGWIIDNLPAVIDMMKAKFNEWWIAIQSVASKVGEELLPKVQALINTVRDDLLPVLTQLWKNVLLPLLPVIGVLLVAALGLAVDALNIIISAFTGLWNMITDGNPIIWGLIGLFGSLAAVMAFNAVFNALTVGFHTLTLITIPSVMTSVGALQALIASPVVFGAIAVAAALVALALVKNAADDAKSAIDGASRAANSAVESNDDVIRKLRAQSGAPFSPEVQDRSRRALQGLADGGSFATGTNYAPGGRTLVGEFGPEYVDMPRGSKVHSNGESANMGGGTNITISGTVNINTPEAATAFWDRVDQTARLSRMGMA